MSSSSLYIGLISGTSMDGIDVALVDLADGVKVGATALTNYDDALRKRLINLCNTKAGLQELGELDSLIGQAFAAAVSQLLNKTGLTKNDIAAIGSHGQSVLHQPADGATNKSPFTLQIGDPNIIAELTGITTVADFRRRDMAAGGQGAPLVPGFHAAIFSKTGAVQVIINIGGIANITIIDSADMVSGWDIGPGNCLLDQFMQTEFGQRFDKSGKCAAQGLTIPELLARLLDDPYFKQATPKSTGPDYFNLAWLQPHLSRLADVHKEDILRTLLVLSSTTISKTISDYANSANDIYLCGGGVHNTLLISEIQQALPDKNIQTTTALGINPDFVEAAAFAWLARQTLIGEAGNVPNVTGAKGHRILGAIYKA